MVYLNKDRKRKFCFYVKGNRYTRSIMLCTIIGGTKGVASGVDKKCSVRGRGPPQSGFNIELISSRVGYYQCRTKTVGIGPNITEYLIFNHFEPRGKCQHILRGIE